MNRRWLAWSLGGAWLALAACDDSSSIEGVVAQAGDHRLTTDQAVDLLVDQEQYPAQADLVKAVAELWIDYTLLGEAAARDSTLAAIDLEPLVMRQFEQSMVFQLRDSVIQVDTAISDTELRGLYASEAPEAQVRARHILLMYPQGATAAARDSVRARAAELHRRIAAGEPFEALARQHSEDPGTAARGGDLGTFGRGELVRPVDEAVFALEPGQVSEPVESPYGVHLLKVEERQVQGFDQVARAYRLQVQSRRGVGAESTYVAALEQRASGRVEEGAAAVMRELARDPAGRLSSRALRRPLISYDGGAVTVADLRDFLRSQSPQYRAQAQTAADAQLESVLQGVLRRALLVREARASGLAPGDAAVDSAVAGARDELRAIVAELGFSSLEVAPGEPRSRAVARAVTAALGNVLTGASDAVPLGAVSFQLRERAPTAVYDAGVGEVILRIGQVRAGRGESPLEGAADSVVAAPDTVAR